MQYTEVSQTRRYSLSRGYRRHVMTIILYIIFYSKNVYDIKYNIIIYNIYNNYIKCI